MDNRYPDPDTTTPAVPAKGNDHKDHGKNDDDDTEANSMKKEKM